MPDERKEFDQADWLLIAEFIKNEKERRAQHPKRKEKERIWKEVDRQIRMEPLPRVTPPGAGQRADWYPELELPLQAQTLEVVQADSRRLRFPRGTAWYRPRPSCRTSTCCGSRTAASRGPRWEPRWASSASRSP